MGAVLLICISGAVILHFVTRYLYLRAHRQLMSDGRQQQQQQSNSNIGSSSHRSPDAQPSNALEMHSVKPTVIVVQPDEEVWLSQQLISHPDVYCEGMLEMCTKRSLMWLCSDAHTSCAAKSALLSESGYKFIG